MDKRGQGGLSMDTIVVAIIAIIVLLLIVTFFTGGLGTIGQKISDVFKKGTVGYDRDLAVKNCEDYCARAQRLVDSGVTDMSNVPYCSQDFEIKGETGRQHCTQLGVSCPGVDC